jgi:hypothetical protein
MQLQATVSALLLLALLAAVPAARSALYKWTDDQGQVHYSDMVPPDAAAHEREVKSSRGITVNRVKAAKTREQLEAERAEREREDARRREEEQARRRQAAADRTLLLTFSNAAEIERARDDRVAAVNGQIALTRDRLERLDNQLKDARQQAAHAERTGRDNLTELHSRIGDLQRRIADYRTFINNREQERANIITKFDADLMRYKELKGIGSR